MEKKKQIDEQEYREQAKHATALLDIQQVLATKAGKSLFYYLFSELAVADLPQQGMPHDAMLEYLGFLRAGKSIFDIVSEASPEMAGTILAQIQKERYAAKILEARRSV